MRPRALASYHISERLHRMKQIGFVGDSPNGLGIILFTDADYAGDRGGHKSTYGCLPRASRPAQFFATM